MASDTFAALKHKSAELAANGWTIGLLARSAGRGSSSERSNALCRAWLPERHDL
jgi:hypothetical protein